MALDTAAAVVVRSRLEATEQLESHPEAVLIRGVVQQHDLHVLGLVEAAHCQRLEEDGDVLSRVHQRHLLALRREEASAAVATLEERSLNAHELAGRERVHLDEVEWSRCWNMMLAPPPSSSARPPASGTALAPARPSGVRRAELQTHRCIEQGPLVRAECTGRTLVRRALLRQREGVQPAHVCVPPFRAHAILRGVFCLVAHPRAAKREVERVPVRHHAVTPRPDGRGDLECAGCTSVHSPLANSYFHLSPSIDAPDFSLAPLCTHRQMCA
eukprot:CAMPEP_0180067346 /NCGR_PEP_ID=MMETSP0985-20121206/9802_1 /TAXON_ID=483367 /ORGANISM="non described non described, Strain CCMP 2436" /LENGTH=271 /DNA_ID=CAMNT_0021997981 /DNA_START=109 /DNA_END=923 /DNA_ORIENTATION=-